ncbi:hypothetical protein O3S68_23285 [Kosakonia sp. SOY2]|uniref:hypothetical protein n=1 Tax=Kosakonia sp. SOY2 TaxID=3014557 RepID=UPI0022AC44C7|nr:hypothetical protein [Kosakonia sp. SOY2]MCZ3385198.1 hypothetical protein [Kosakonia sp. SOY2]
MPRFISLYRKNKTNFIKGIFMLRWIHWWRDGWRHKRHHSWPLPEELHLIHAVIAHAEAHQRHWIDSLFGVKPAAIPEPTEAVINVIELLQHQRVLLFEALFCVCVDHPQSVYRVMSSGALQWCRRLAMGLKPGLWTPPLSPDPDITGIILLRSWVGEPVWSRMRFSLPKEKVEEVERQPVIPVTAHKLSMLWMAVIAWIQRECPRENGHVNGA